MKIFLFTILCLSVTHWVAAQNTAVPDSNKVIVREKIDVTSAYNARKTSTGIFLLATSKSGYTIAVQNKKGLGSVFIVKNPNGVVVPTIGKRKVIRSEGRAICMECINVNRPGGTEEECYEVACTAKEILTL